MWRNSEEKLSSLCSWTLPKSTASNMSLRAMPSPQLSRQFQVNQIQTLVSSLAGIWASLCNLNSDEKFVPFRLVLHGVRGELLMERLSHKCLNDCLHCQHKELCDLAPKLTCFTFTTQFLKKSKPWNFSTSVTYWT